MTARPAGRTRGTTWPPCSGYRGDLLAGLGATAPPFEDWLMSERERLQEFALGALARLLAQQRASGESAPAVQSARRLLALDPLQEAVHRTLMRLYAQVGRRDAALRQYQDCEAGSPARAIPLLEQAVDAIIPIAPRGQARGWCLVVLAEALLQSGELRGARECATQGLEILEAARYRDGLARARRALGRIAQAEGAHDEAMTGSPRRWTPTRRRRPGSRSRAPTWRWPSSCRCVEIARARSAT
jgi:tetratricopeptide (TPR) repeat protein